MAHHLVSWPRQQNDRAISEASEHPQSGATPRNLRDKHHLGKFDCTARSIA